MKYFNLFALSHKIEYHIRTNVLYGVIKMKLNKLTPGRNLLWEGSRMMLPEHKEEIIKQNKKVHLKQRPTLDEQKWEEISRVISESVEHGLEIELIKFGDFQDRSIRGIVEKVDMQLRHLKVVRGDEFEWVKIGDIVEVNDVLF